ncbi:MAG TPA: ABC transporter permease, partial [Thermoanaerobaculia bacterium]|nr:ABC transporter permease [Thermoanaerobaculia bacterium]
MKNLLVDISRAVRSLRSHPVTSLVITATVAIGIAAGATVFSIMDTLLLRSLPGVERQSELVNVHATAADGSTFHSVSYPTYKDLRDRSRSLSGLTAFSSRLVSLATGEEPRLGIVQIVSGNYFDVLGARAASGRLLAPGDDKAGGDLVAVVSLPFARDSLRGLSSAVGQTLKINGRTFTIVGVAPAGFCGTFLAQPFDVWVPISAWAAIGPNVPLDQRDRSWLELVGRKRDGVSLPQVRADLEPIARQLEKEYPAIYRSVGYDPRSVTGFEDSLLSGALGVFGVLSAMAALILLVGCVNVAGIFLARSASRAREIAVRAALGARRHELVRPLLLEQMVLFVAGGGLGLALTAWTATLLERFDIPTSIPLRFDFSPTIRVAVFALALSVGVGLVFGLSASIFATRRVSSDALRGRFELPGASRALASIVAVQLAACVLLLACAGLFIRTVLQAVNRNPGFEPENLVLTTVDLS